MKKIILLLLCASKLCAQSPVVIAFDKVFVDCINQWVILQPKDSIFPFGFVYLDSQAGLTLDMAGHFTLKDSTFVVEKEKNASYKYRLSFQENIPVAIVPEAMYKKLDIQKVPDWLDAYKTDENSPQYMYAMGYLYNEWNECAKAVPFLERAMEINPDFVSANGSKLAVELAFSYNCLNQSEKAISVLQTSLKNDSTDAYIYKELIYAQIKSDKMSDATVTFDSAIKACKNTEYNGENAFNILATFFNKNDMENFEKWLSVAKEWNEKNNTQLNNTYLNKINAMENEINKKR